MTPEQLKHVQDLLNRVGGLLVTDGKIGPNTRRAIADGRKLAGLPAGNEADQALIDWLEGQPEPSPDLPTEGVTFIAREEVGSRNYYESKTTMPHWPGGASGITIGVGYDLRFSEDTFDDDWGARLPADVLTALRPHLGKQGSAAEAEALKWIRVPWTTAWQAFIGRSLPTQVTHTKGVYTTFDSLPGLCRTVLVSLVFNRGPSIEDKPGSDRRREMRAIRDLLLQGKPAEVPDQILSMRRLWPDAEGLRRRRTREAALWEKSLGAVEHA